MSPRTQLRKPVSATATPAARGARSVRRARPGPGARSAGILSDVDLGGLTDHLGYLIRRAQLWIFQDFIRTLAAIDIRPAQYSVMTVIGANPGLSQMSLAQALGIERARVVHLIDALETRRLVRRHASRHDRRSHALHLTPDGQRMLGRIRELAMRHEKHLIEKIGADHHKMLLRLFAVFAKS